ncbi:2-hydroxy-3-oxopropionate reductase [Enterovibrio norvegicus]|uniref:2-hydroxy-3-oxopropionate reductase n=1 Tax=Enterovibrio norvegicus TaxID=188144 RepID=UPI000C83F6C1|nr:2-hydroxy-3-oxopropionate reductase [Enterovibrio norvegicus]PMI28718.1 2-hydroxy-3-oxopropionate reductase [Enterovibrio norvegicus]TKF14225.1 2-hydroxy-3-oxopropionate reductase [Enterovibrio norvegicus]
MSTIAFIGTGIMGKPMAENLQKSGYQLHLSEARSPAPTSLVDGGAKRFPSNRLAVEHADFVIIMVPDTPQVKDVLFGDDGIDAMLAAGKTVIDMSSISPIETRQFAERVKAFGADYLDAPVSGGEVGAINAALTIMVGGDKATFENALPLFGAMGKNINLVGDCGAGQVCKVANQIIVALNIEAVSEALVFASKAGADPARIREALLGGFANSKVLEVHGERMVQGTFDPGFRIALHQKDLNLALTGAASLGVALPNTQKAQELFEICAEQGGASWDHSAMVKAIETLSNHSIR